MNKYIITTDSTVDLGVERLKELGVSYIQLTYALGNETFSDEMTDESALSLYEGMRNGNVYKSSQANSENYIAMWKPLLEEGYDILYVGFSSGLSGSVNSSLIAKESLEAEYPGKKIYVVDSLCASGGEGLFLELVVKKKDSGASVEECYEYAEGLKSRIHHWFTVDDLVYLKRGGRVSAAAAAFAGVLNIKPVLNMNIEGKLIPREKVRGRKAAIKGLLEHLDELVDLEDNAYFRITHADCLEDAVKLKTMVQEKYNNIPVEISMIGAVIGSHCGPGTLALFFVGKERVI